MNQKRCVIFDLDGTLFDTSSVTVSAVQSVFINFELAVPAVSQIEAFIGKPQEAFHQWLLTLTQSHNSKKIIQAIDEMEMKYAVTNGTLYDGVLEVLNFCKKSKFVLAICSNGTPGYVVSVLNATGIESSFDLIRPRKSFSETKTEMTKEIIDSLGCIKGYFVGDRQEDMMAGKDNNMISIGAGYGFGSADELRLGDYRVETPIEIIQVIKKSWDPQQNVVW